MSLTSSVSVTNDQEIHELVECGVSKTLDTVTVSHNCYKKLTQVSIVSSLVTQIVRGIWTYSRFTKKATI